MKKQEEERSKEKSEEGGSERGKEEGKENRMAVKVERIERELIRIEW